MSVVGCRLEPPEGKPLTRLDALMTVTRTSVVFKVDSLTGIVRYFNQGKTGSDFNMHDSYVSEDSFNIHINGMHIIATKEYPPDNTISIEVDTSAMLTKCQLNGNP